MTLQLPKERQYGWPLKPIESTLFEIIKRPNGQYCVVLQHSLIRGVTCEMIHWWFLHFPDLSVRLEDTPGYEGKTVPAYFLWHPSDHIGVKLVGRASQSGSNKGRKIKIQEVMQAKSYGDKYPVDNAMTVLYHGKNGWAMGKQVPFIGPAMVLRIHFKDVYEGDTIIGVHYHYEVVAGPTGSNPLAKLIRKKLAGHFSKEFWSAWNLHNSIEVGTFENFLPALFKQRNTPDSLVYRLNMNPIDDDTPQKPGFDNALFDTRVAGYKTCNDPFKYQDAEDSSFLW